MFLPLVLVELALYHECIRVTDMFPPLVVQMHTGSTNNHISQIFFLLAASVYWWDWLLAPVPVVPVAFETICKRE
jgi:hypothetical protein